MSDDLIAYDESYAARVHRMLEAFEAGRLDQVPPIRKVDLPGPRWTMLGKTAEIVPAAAGSVPGTGTTSLWFYDSASETYADTDIDVEAMNPTGTSIGSGEWVALFRDPKSGQYWAIPCTAGGGTIAEPLDAQESVSFSGDLTPPAITADQNDYSPAGLADASVLRLASDASRSITGIAGGSDGRLMILSNVGSNPILLPDDSGSSTAGNRIDTGGSTMTLSPGSSAVLMYDSTASRWRPLAGWQGTPVLSSGVSGGQTLTGGTGSGDDLVLQGTSHGTPGTVDTLTQSGDTNTVREAERTRHLTSGTPAAGFGVRRTDRLENASGTEVDAASQDAVWTDATGGSEDADLVFRLARGGSMTEAARLVGTGAWRIPEVSAPATPASGHVLIYAKSDGLVYSKDDAGTETVVTGTGDVRDAGTVAAAGSTQGDAAALTYSANSVTGADGTKGVIVPNTAGAILTIRNSDTMNQLKVYPPSGAQFNTLGTDNPITLFANANLVVLYVTSTEWASITPF